MSKKFKTVIISCHEKEDTRMVYRTNKEGIIKVEQVGGGIVEFSEFTLERLTSLIVEHNEDGYQVMSISNNQGRGGGEGGLTLASTVVLSKEVVYGLGDS